MPTTATNLQETLENLVDNNDLPSILEALAQTCYAKAEHVEVTWSDHFLSGVWTRAGIKIDNMTTHQDMRDLS